MLGNFTYENPTRLHFGREAMGHLPEELARYGSKVLLVYGGGSIKTNGIYEQVINILRENGKEVIELGGIPANPTLEKLHEGIELVRKHDVDFMLAVGGGSVIDYTKGLSASAWCEEDPWEKYYLRQEEPTCRIIPLGCILTMVGTGSEMNGGSVITNTAAKLKIGKVFGTHLMPRFAILNPCFTFTVPQTQMVAGFFDVLSHLCEQYFSDTDDNTSDYIAEGLMRSLIHSSLLAIKNPEDYEARSNIMWTATWALNTLTKMGKSQDWMVHMIGQSIGAHTNATHGMTLSAVSLPYYRCIMADGLHKFVRFATNVWGIDDQNLTPEETAKAGLEAMKQWMKAIGVCINARELGVTEEMIDGIVDSTFILTRGYKTLTRDDIRQIIEQSMREA